MSCSSARSAQQNFFHSSAQLFFSKYATMISAIVVGAFSTLKLKQKRKYNLSNATNLDRRFRRPKFALIKISLRAKIRSGRKFAQSEKAKSRFASLSLRSENFHGASLRFRSRKFQDFRFRSRFLKVFRFRSRLFG